MFNPYAGYDFTKEIKSPTETNFGPSMLWIDSSSKFAMEKIAKAGGLTSSHIPPELASVIDQIKGKLPHNKVAFYNRALGSFESYGINKNGDGWFREELMKKHATFVEAARYFRNHANRLGIDPEFGRPIASAFNRETDMIDLIIVADMDKQAEEDVQTLESGGQVFTSMGCRVKFDVCTICDHHAKNPDEYCEHVHKKLAQWPYGMGNVLSDGRVCGVMNPDPVFFDISRVRNPAFVGSENLLKVAEAAARCGSVAASMQHTLATRMAKRKRMAAAAQEKSADMIKRIPAQTQLAVVGDDVVGRYSKAAPKLDVREAIKQAGTLNRALRASLALGVIWSPEEYAEGLEATTGQKVASRGWPARAQILSAPMSAAALVAWAQDAPETTVCDKIAEDRSFLQPTIFNRLMHIKAAGVTANGHVNSGPVHPGYLEYRSSCLRHYADGFSGIDTEKVADSMTRTTSGISRDIVLGAWTRESVHASLEKAARVMDTGAVSFVTGSMMEDLGVLTLDQMAHNTLA